MSEKIKMGIISDTHGLLREEVKERLKDCTYIFHAGDVDRPEILDELRTMGFLYVVRGNNDGYWAQNLRRSLNFSVGNVKFFMVHDRKDAAWELGDTQVVTGKICPSSVFPFMSAMPMRLIWVKQGWIRTADASRSCWNISISTTVRILT